MLLVALEVTPGNVTFIPEVTSKGWERSRMNIS
jgi:hypothetical protein